MVRREVVTRHREHNRLVFRLTDEGKDDRRALLEGDAQGSMLEILEALAPEPA